jgi:CheY-like chemotaxis protein
VRILVVEDNEEFYENYLLRIFSNLLPVGKIEFTRSGSLQQAAALLIEPWDVVLMDYVLEDPGRVPPDDPNGFPVRTGSDLVALRRRYEKEDSLAPAHIIGISSHHIGNHAMSVAGSNENYLKLQVPEMARAILTKVPK